MKRVYYSCLLCMLLFHGFYPQKTQAMAYIPFAATTIGQFFIVASSLILSGTKRADIQAIEIGFTPGRGYFMGIKFCNPFAEKGLPSLPNFRILYPKIVLTISGVLTFVGYVYGLKRATTIRSVLVALAPNLVALLFFYTCLECSTPIFMY